MNQTRACSKSVFGGKIRPVTPVLFDARAALEEKRSLRNEKLKAQTELHRLKNRGMKG